MKHLTSFSHMTLRYAMVISLVMITLLTSSCNSDGFKVEGDKVYYTYWTFSFGPQKRELPGADAATFDAVNEWLGRDAKHVYFKERLVEGADPATVEVVKFPVFRDKKDCYIEGASMHVAHVQNFKLLQHDPHVWATDGQFAYYDSTRLQVKDIKKFKLIDWSAATDGIDVWYFGKKLAGVDPASFKILEACYVKDKSHVWFLDRILDGADPATFKVLEHGYAKDKNHVWYDELIVPDADVASFGFDQYGDPCDKNGRFVQTERYVPSDNPDVIDNPDAQYSVEPEPKVSQQQ